VSINLFACLFVCLLACLQKVYFAIFSAMPLPILILFFVKNVEFQAQTFAHRTFSTILCRFLTKCEKLISQSEQKQNIHT
jgi:hypothetical protein